MLRFTLARRALLALAAGALFAGAAIPATTASADDGCYVQLDAPSKIAIKRPYTDVEVSLIDSCGIADYAAFDEYGPNGFDNIFIFDQNITDHWDVYSWQTPGTFDSRSAGAWDSDYNELDFQPTRTVVKYASKAGITTKRSGKKVTISVKSTSYSPEDRYKAWNASKATIEYKSGSTWKKLKSVKLKGGKAKYGYSSKSKRSYRFKTSDGSVRFGATSATSRR